MRVVVACVFVLVLASCVPNAPRALPATSPENLKLAAKNFLSMPTVRIDVQTPDGRSETADVRLPDAIAVRGSGDVGPFKEAIEIAGSLGTRGTPRPAGDGAVLGYLTKVWVVGDMRVSLSQHDSLPRSIEIGDPVRRTYLFKDYGAAINPR